jgi:hypothetical protein
MKRQDKYPETSVFHYHNQNPRNRITTDCVIRAISAATEIPYNQVVMEMAELQCKTGYDDGDVKLYDQYLKSKGWHKYPQPRKPDGTKYTGKEFCQEASHRFELLDRSIVANIGGGHMVCIKSNTFYEGHKIWDIWDCSHKCIGNYWIKP